MGQIGLPFNGVSVATGRKKQKHTFSGKKQRGFDSNPDPTFENKPDPDPTVKKYLMRHPSLSTVCPRSSDPFYLVGYYIKWVTTSWTYSN